MRIRSLTISLLISFNCFMQASTLQPDSITINQHAIDEITINAPINILSVKQWTGSIALIDSLTLQLGNSYLLAQQLNSLPGVLMQQGNLNTSRITIRGIGSRTPYNSNRIKAYWGDIPLTDGDGVTSIEDIGLNDINTIQVLKGPSSALYGAGLGGVILINPWPPRSNNILTIKSEAGRYNTFSNHISAALKQQKGTTWITANQLNSDGYRDNSQYKRYNLTLKGRYKVGMHYLHYLYNYRYLNGHIPSSLDSIDFYNQPEKAADSWAAIKGYEQSNRHLLNIGLKSGLNPRLSNVLNIYITATSLDELRPFNQLDESKIAIGFRNQLRYRSKRIRLTAGIEAMTEINTIKLYGVKENNLGQLLSKNKIERRYINMFELLDFDITDKLIVQTGLNFNITKYVNKDKLSGHLSNHQYPTTLSPRIGINYQLSNTSNLFAASGHGFSTPSVEEAQMPDGSFNASIKPEEGYHVDVGYRYNSRSNNTKANITIYWMKMKNLLVTKRETEAIFYGINAGETQHKGLELSLNHKIDLSPQSNILLSGTFSHSLNKFEEFTDNGVDYVDKHLPGIPSYTTYLAATYSVSKTQLHINYRLNGRQYLSDFNDKTYGAFSIINTKVSYSTLIGRLPITLHIGVNNIGNAHYASMLLINAPSFGNNQPRYYYPALPRNGYGGITIKI